MIIAKNTIIPSVDDTLGILTMYNHEMPQYVDFDKVMMYIGHLQMEIKKVSGPLFNTIGKPVKTDASGNMKYWLSDKADLTVFETTKTGISLEKESIASAIESGKLSEEVISVLNQYSEYANLAHTRSTLVSLLQNPIAKEPSYDGHRMLVLRPEWAGQNTGRVAMRKPAIQNFPRNIQDIQTVPRGFVYCHTDSGQIEPRETYSFFIPDPQIQTLIRLYNDAYYGLLHYCTMPEEDIINKRMNFEKMEITPELKEMRQKIKTYGNAVMYGSKSNPTGDPIKAAMIKRIGEHPLRVAKVNEYRERIRRGERIFHTYFGTPIDITKSPKIAGGKYESVEEQFLKLAINNPIQGTAADLMRYSVQQANRIIMLESPKSSIINYVHDAGSFAIYEDDFDKVKDKLGNIVSYEVEDWLPIYAEPEFGRANGEHGIFKDYY